MKDNQDKIEHRESKDLVKRMLEHLKSILDKYMTKFPKYEELIAIMDDEKNMYDADGKPSAEYLKLIEEFNNHCAQNPIDIEEIAKEDGLEQNKIDALNDAKDFLDKQSELMESYRRSEDKDDWLNQRLDSKEKREIFGIILEESTCDKVNDIETLVK